MGINQFAALLNILFPSSVSLFNWSQASTKYDHILIDLNCLLYVLRSVKQDDAALIIAVVKYIDNLLQVLPPTTTLFLALDGSPPIGKFSTSIERRATAAAHAIRFTPGTEFMRRLKDALCFYAGRTLDSSPNLRIIVSGADREGEGEYKIFEYLSNLHVHDPQILSSEHRQKCLILGNDTDLILSSMLLSQRLQFDILRVDPAQDTLICVDKVKKAILNDLQGEESALLDDWIFLTLLCGTDYTPRLGGFDYRQVYATWRKFKTSPLHRDDYIIFRQRFEHPSHFTSAFSINLANFDKVLRGSNFTSLHFYPVKVVAANKTRDVNISSSDWKGNWNVLKQAFCKDLTISTENVAVREGGHKFIFYIHWIDPTTSTKLVAGKGEGINIRTAEFFACLEACLPSSSIMQRHIQNHVSKTEYQSLCKAITAAADPTSLPEASSAETTSTSTSHVFSAELQAEKRTQLSHAANVMDSSPDACKELLKGVFWTMSMLGAEIQTGLFHYPLSVPPSVEAMQNFIAQVGRTSTTFICSFDLPTNPTLTETAPSSSAHKMRIPFSDYANDALPPLQFLAQVALNCENQDTALSTTTSSARKLIKDIGITPFEFQAEYITQSVSSSSPSSKVTAWGTPQKRGMTLSSLVDRRQEFNTQLKAHVASAVEKAEEAAHLEGSLSAFFQCEPSLLFLNPTSTGGSTSAKDDQSHQSSVFAHAQVLEQWRNHQLDTRAMAKSVPHHLATWCGPGLRHMACFAETRDSRNPRFRAFMTPVKKLPTSSRQYSTTTASSFNLVKFLKRTLR